MKTYCFIFARGGSKGIPNKNIVSLNGKPLVVHSIEAGKNIPEVERVFVSTDSCEISDIAIKNGAEVIQRPAELAGDDSPEWSAWQHAIGWVQKHFGTFDVFLSLPCTSPLRSTGDVRRCVESLSDDIDVVVTMSPAKRSPRFNMVRVNPSGHIELLANSAEHITNRQKIHEEYDLTTVAYVSRPEFIMKNGKIWSGKVRGVVIPEERSIDIDTPLDLALARILMRGRLEIGDDNEM